MLPKESLLKKCKCSPEQLVTSSPRPNSVLYTMARIVRLEGPFALYAGLPPTLLFAVPSTAMYFTSYEMLMMQGKDAFPNVNPGVMAMASGSLARAGAATVFSPLELIRVQMQSGETTHSFTTHFRQVAKGGMRQLYRGLGATLARDIPFSALYWFGIETSKAYLSSNGGVFDKCENSQWRQVTIAFVAGVLAGTFATVATHPFDVVKTRKQFSIYSPTATDGAGASLSSRAMLAQVWRQEGLAGFSAGLVPRAVKVAPACAIMISTYEAAKIAFEKNSNSTT
jgi:solute carrier family 25 protein 39/40